LELDTRIVQKIFKKEHLLGDMGVGKELKLILEEQGVRAWAEMN
jgi:hypothetical protein